jgi:trehalose 6-phosphate phosphatase
MSESLWPVFEEATQGLARAGRILACFDYDGTLVPIRPTPEEAIAEPPVRDALSALARVPGVDVAVVSGRPLDDLRNLVPSDGLWLVGHHGLSVQSPRGVEPSMVDESVAKAALEPLRTEARAIVSAGEGLRFEDKGSGVALHYRNAPRPVARQAAEAFRKAAGRLEGFSLLEGKEVLEVRPAGVDKGRAVRALHDRIDPDAAIAYVGDDTTDEDAFRAVADLPDALTVKVGEEKSAARYRVDGPEDVLDLLHRLARLRDGQD